MITRWEKNSLLFYKNATENISFTDKEEYLREFYSIENAYEAINTLLFPGVENEKVRVLSEKRVLPTALLDNMSELLNVYCRIYSIMCKYTRNESKKKLYTYRVDRMNTLDYLEQGKTCSFLSTSRNHEISTYYHKKAGLLLLEVEALGTIEHVDVNAVLGEDFKYPEEEEVLFAPFLYLSKIPIVMTEEERTFVDINDEPPKGKYRLKLLVSATEEQRGQMEKTDIDVFANLKEKILLDDEIENAKKVWNNLADGNMAEQKCVEQYIEWKETLHKYLIQEFSQIKENVEKDYNERMYLFREKLNNLFETSNNKRKEYEKRLMSYQRILSILQPLMLFFFALSFLDCLETISKIFGFTTATVCMILTNLCKSESLTGKYRQRTVTFLKADELKQRFDFEKNLSDDVLEEYIQELLELMRSDDKFCVENVDYLLAHLGTMFEVDNKLKE